MWAVTPLHHCNDLLQRTVIYSFGLLCALERSLALISTSLWQVWTFKQVAEAWKSSKTHWIQWTLPSLLYVHLALHLLIGPEDDFRFIPNLLSTRASSAGEALGMEGPSSQTKSLEDKPQFISKRNLQPWKGQTKIKECEKLTSENQRDPRGDSCVWPQGKLWTQTAARPNS